MVNNNVYKLAESSWGREELDAIQRVVDSGMFTMGSEVSSFERAAAEYFGSKYAVMVNSGSSANLLMIAALFYAKNPYLKSGDEVIVPAVSWSTTYFPLYQYGLKIKFVDINKGTLNLDIENLKTAISEKTKAILCVNLLGNPNEFNEILKITNERNILILEDNCESMGAMYQGRFCGTLGLMGTFSTFFSHHISTMEGGFVLTDNEELFHIMLCLRAHGWTRNLPNENHVTGKKDTNQFYESFRFVLPGYNLRPLEMSGAIGLEQLKKLKKFIDNRRENAKYFKEKLHKSSIVMIQEEIEKSSWFGFSLVLKEEFEGRRDDLLRILNNTGFETRPIVAGNFAKNEVMKYLTYEIHGKLSNADYIDKNGLFIGNHHYDCKLMISFLEKALL